MHRRLAFTAAALTFLILLALMVWQGSFSFSFHPSDVRETIVLSAISAFIFLLAIVLAFMLFRAAVKTYLDRRQNREGSRIRWKLLLGAAALTIAPALFSALFNYTVLNRTLDKWFTQPARGIEMNLKDLDKSFRQISGEKVQAEANWISLLPQTVGALKTGHGDAAFFRGVCKSHGIRQLVLTPRVGIPTLACQSFEPASTVLQKSAEVSAGGLDLGRISVTSDIADEPAQRLSALQRFTDEQKRLAGRKKFYQDTYFLMICLLTLFVLFFAAWIAQVLSRQISVPIAALLGAAQQVRRGNLSYRIRVNAMDELATLVRAFNEMTNELEANGRELEARRNFTEAILESIPTGVISLSADEHIERVNRALSGILPQQSVQIATRLSDLFASDDLAEIRYLLKRARRTGAAACQLDVERGQSVLHLAVTAASLPQKSGYVMVIEDTSDFLRAQKAAAWQEVARRIAHEIKNPLTPISLCADRIARQLRRVSVPREAGEIFDECVQTIQQEVQTVKTLVDEFSQFSRFPAAQFAAADLNEVVESAISVFAGRLDGITVRLQLDRSIGRALIDREQMKRVIVNLVENAVDAMEGLSERILTISTLKPSPETIELSIADTGCGVSPADKEKLFLPYFSTKQRGTGLGLAIVSHIVTEHRGRVFVRDNFPQGARFVVELNALAPFETASRSDESAVATLEV